jgi:arylsulfatase A-like enzyme
MKRFMVIVIPLLLLVACGTKKTENTGSSDSSVAVLSEHDTSSNIPKSDPNFKGTITPTIVGAKADYPPPVRAPKGAPNVLVILLDDVGFGQTSTFGGPVPTLTLDRLAKNGLMYNRFFTTALCSPTRAALLTGRNHHSAGTGVIIEMGTGYPGYTGMIPKSTALVSKMLQGNGYATACMGKWHNTPDPDLTPSGPFDRWPTGMGFDYFYGFNNGETHQYYPVLYRNTTAVDPPKTPEQGYHFINDMTNETIQWIGNAHASKPDQPWFLYYSSPAAHAPHHAPKEWRDKFKGQFDQGWDKLREETFERQKKLGIIPANTQLTPRPPEIPSWDSQSSDAKKVYTRLMENYAGYLAYADNEIGRVINYLDQSDQLNNTLIFYIVGDNGPSAEGGLEGTFSEMASLLGYNPGLKGMLSRIDEIGGPTSEPHVPVGWAWACASPLKWTKQVASHFGGTCNPLIVHWPDGIQAKGEMRSQFHHIIDVVPTILEASHIKAPEYVDGIKQKPLEGVSMLYSFNDANATSKHTVQYFEMMGNRAIYKDGWVACSRFGVPWVMENKDVNQLNSAAWELYNINEDFSEATDLASKNQDKLADLRKIFDEEAKKYNVYPIDVRMTERFNPALRETGAPKSNWTYYTSVRIPINAGPLLWVSPFEITADVDIPSVNTEGVMACAGGLTGGWTFFVMNGRLNFEYNYFDFERHKIVSSQRVPVGKVSLKGVFVPNAGVNRGGTFTIYINGQQAGQTSFDKSSFALSGEPFEVGQDAISPVSMGYKSKGKFPFSGKINKVTFQLTSAQHANVEAKKQDDQIAYGNE